MYLSTPAHSVCGGRCQVSRMVNPAKKWFFISSSQLTRDICNVMGDILLKVRGAGVKVWFWIPFGRETTKCKSFYHACQKPSTY